MGSFIWPHDALLASCALLSGWLVCMYALDGFMYAVGLLFVFSLELHVRWFGLHVLATSPRAA